MKQLSLWRTIGDRTQPSLRISSTCPECGGKMSRKDLKVSIWGLCKGCENGRLGTVR